MTVVSFWAVAVETMDVLLLLLLPVVVCLVGLSCLYIWVCV